MVLVCIFLAIKLTVKDYIVTRLVSFWIVVGSVNFICHVILQQPLARLHEQVNHVWPHDLLLFPDGDGGVDQLSEEPGVATADERDFQKLDIRERRTVGY